MEAVFQVKMQAFVSCKHFPEYFLGGICEMKGGDSDALLWFPAQVTVCSDSSVASRQELFIFVH